MRLRKSKMKQNKNFEKITQLCIEARKAALERQKERKNNYGKGNHVWRADASLTAVSL